MSASRTLLPTPGRRHLPFLLAGFGLAIAPGFAQAYRDAAAELADKLVPADLAAPTASVAPLFSAAETSAGLGAAWQLFESESGGTWIAEIDRRTGRLAYAEGSGLAWIPGFGNDLTAADLDAPLGAGGEVALQTLESLARSFVDARPELFAVPAESLALSPERSLQLADYLWAIEFDLRVGDLPVDGASVFFYVNNGNLIQFGTRNLPSPDARLPELRIPAEEAMAIVDAHLEALAPSPDEVVRRPALRLLPVQRKFDTTAEASPIDLQLVWEMTFRKEGVVGNFRARVDAETGELVSLEDVNRYPAAAVTGGVRRTDNLPADTVLPMPYANLSIGGFANSAGIYNYVSGTVSSTLNGQYVRIVDTCGAISQSGNAGTSGNILFGSSGGTDCTTPGSGGAGNTRASRTQYYHVNRAKEAARGWLPANAWINAQLTANVNLNQTCNAYWSGTSLNFFLSGGGCANTGELPGVSLHEYGHGLDDNDGNPSAPEFGTGEAYGDFTAALATHSSCVGGGFLGSACGGYGNPCDSCTGVRDIDFMARQDNLAATVANFTQTQCPPPSMFNPHYVGPCGADARAKGGGTAARREGHCESYVSSEALWDFPSRDLPNPGTGAAWSVADRLWYLSRSMATSSFSCNTTPGTWTSTGCNSGTLFRTMRAVDDDDGNLANGTPHGCDLHDAMNRHGISCATDPGATTCFAGCTAPAVPALTVTPGSFKVYLEWSSSGPGAVYDVYRSEGGCNAGFTRIAGGVSATTYTDTAVGNSLTYSYQVVAYPAGNGACASAPSSCLAAAPCSPLAAPGGVGAAGSGDQQITVTWGAVGGATSYRVLRGTSPAGPFVTVGTVTAPTTNFVDNTAFGVVTYYYLVRATNAGGCQSDDSAVAAASTSGLCDAPPAFAGLTSATNAGTAGCSTNLSWSAATPFCGGPVSYQIYRSTTAGFTPSAANRIASGVTGTAFADTAALVSGTPYFYVVRAIDDANGVEDVNTVYRSAAPFGAVGAASSLYSQNFDGCAVGNACGYTMKPFSANSANSWVNVRACTAQSGSNVLRFGSATNCAQDYIDNNFVMAVAPAIAVPAGSTTTRLSFWHRYWFEAAWDGGLLALSLDDLNYIAVPSAAFLTNGYNGTTDNGAGYPAWTGNFAAAFTNPTVNLDTACNAITGLTTGCAGRTIYLGFVAYADVTVNEDGWFVDTVSVTANPAAACSSTPAPVSFLTATGRSEQVTMEWLNPTTAPFASTRVRASTVAYPVDPNADGVLVGDVGGVVGGQGSVPYATGAGTNGVPHFVSAFASNGGGLFGLRKTISPLPQATSGNWKWNFTTPAAALAPPIQGRGLGIYLSSNDRGFYGLAVGSASGGVWKTGYRPAGMNAPSQSSPVVMLDADTSLPHDAAFVSSQDGYLYCFHAGTGAGCAGWPAGGRSVSNFGFLQAQPMFDPATQRILFGTRNVVGINAFHAVNVANGATAWSFTNSVPQGGDGLAMGSVNGPALILGGQVIFTSRVRPGGSQHSVWALNFTAGSASLAWTRDLGGIDAAPTHDFTLGRVIVGTNGGEVYALDPLALGNTVWSRAFGNGPVKSFVYYHAAIARLYFTTDTTVWSIPASGATGSDWSLGGLSSPTRPLLHFTTTRTYVGACNNGGCANGRVIELDAANSWAAPKTLDLAGVGGLGPVTIDRTQSPALLHAGSRFGRAVAVELPLP